MKQHISDIGDDRKGKIWSHKEGRGWTQINKDRVRRNQAKTAVQINILAVNTHTPDHAQTTCPFVFGLYGMKPESFPFVL